ncbi:MAG: permease [Motilibacteraceae bacterium]
MTVLDTIGRSLAAGAGMFWETLWALVLGFALSGAVQAFVSRAEMQRALGDHRPRTIAKAGFFGAISSSCSYAAAALAKTLFGRGADFTAAQAFMFASTNLVVELGIVLWLLIGWQFAVAEFVGGAIMIVLLTLVLPRVVRPAEQEAARARLGGGQDTDSASAAHAGHGDPDASAAGSWRTRIRSLAGWSDAAAPWLVRQGIRAGDRRAVGRLAWAAAAGFLVAAAVTAALGGAGLLRGPALLGLPGAGAEALVLAGVGAGLPTARGLLRALRGPAPVRSAWLDGQLLARSADVVMVEGNAYFPAEAVRPGVLTPSDTRTVCPWKGVAGYYTISVDGVQHPDTAWTYRHPSPLARRIKDRVAFWGDVEVRVEPRSADDGPARADTGDRAQERMRP